MNTKFSRRLILGVALAVVFLMVTTSFSGAFYVPSNGSSSGSGGSHVYLVTTTVGNQNHSYYEQVENGKVIKTWPAPSAVSGSSFNNSSSIPIVNSSSSTGSNILKVINLTSSGSTSNSSDQITNQSVVPSMDNYGNGNTGGGSFNVTQTYTLTSIILSPTSSNIYVGQTLHFVATWVGGQSPYTYVWQVTQTPSYVWFNNYQVNTTSTTTSNFDFTPGHPGTYLVSLTVNGTGTGYGMETSSIVSVIQQQQYYGQGDRGSQYYQSNLYSLQNITLTPSTSLMYSGKPIDFVGNWTGSSSTYQYAWVVSTDQTQWKSYYEGVTNQIDQYNTTTQPTTSFTFNPVYGSYGIYYIYLYVIPSSGYGPDNQQDSLVAYAQIILLPGTPGVSSVTISPGSINVNSDSGVPINFKGNWTGGAAPYSYAWMVTFRDPIKTPYILQFGSYNYTSSTSSTFSFTPSDSGQYYVYLFVDSTTSSAYMMAVAQIDSQENLHPTVTQVSLTPTTVDTNIGETINFNANWTGGSSPYSYVWYVSSSFPYWQSDFKSFSRVNTTSLPKAQFSYVPSTYGIYYLYLFVNNNVNYRPSVNDEDHDDGLAIIATAEIIVLHPALPLTSSAITISPTTAPVGTPISATVEPGYGIGPFTYSWSVTTSSGGPATGDYTSSGNQITFSKAGTYTVTVSVTDSKGVSASLTRTITIIGQISLSIAVSGYSTIDSGQSATLVATSITGGYSPYTGQWWEEAPLTSSFVKLGNQFSATSSDLSSATISTGILTTTGAWLFKLQVTDSSSTIAYSGVVTIKVNKQLSVTLSSTVTQLDSGGSVTFTNSTTGGTQPFTYSYSVSPTTGWTQSSNPGNTFTFNSPGTYVVTLKVKDGAGVVVTSSETITVEAALAVSVQPTSYSIDPSQQLSSLTSAVEYGSGSYTWQWYSGTVGSGTSISGASGSGPSASFLPTGSGSYYVVFKDSIGQSVSSNAASVTENSAPSVSVSPSTSDIEVSQSVLLSATVYGGSGTFSYSWTLGRSTDVVGTGSGYSFSASSSGTYKVWLNVTDTGTTPDYSLSSIYVTVTVYNTPTVAITPSSATLDVSQSLDLTSAVDGGSGHFSYSWSIGGVTGPVGSSSSYLFAETSAKSYEVSLTVTDTGTTTQYVASATISIMVDSAPSISVQPSSVTIDPGQSISITSTVVGGTGTYSWEWYDSSGAVTGSTGTGTTASLTISAADTGIYVLFTDTGVTSGASPPANAKSNSVSVSVDTSLSVTVQPISGTMDPGQSYSLTSTVTGGTGSYSWKLYTSSNIFVTSGTGDVASYQVSPATTTSYFFKFTDSGVSGGAAPPESVSSDTATITVNPSFVPGITPSSATIPSDQSQLFTSTTVGGSGHYSYSWTVGKSTTVVSTTDSYLFTSGTTGTFKLWLNVTDTGTTVPYTLTITATVLVNTATLSVSFNFNTPSTGTASLDKGQTIDLSVTPTIVGGVSPYSYQWYLNGTTSAFKQGSSGAATSGTAIAYTFTPSGKGNFNFYLEISSSDGLSSASSAISIIVYAAPSISAQPKAATIDSGQSVTLSSTVTGGTAAFSWTVYNSAGTALGSGTGKTASYTIQPQANDSYHFTFVDTGVSSSANPAVSKQSSTVTVTVYADPSVTVLPSTIGSGSSVTLTATAAGGTKLGYSFKWYSDSALTNLVYSGDPFTTPVLTSTITYYVTVTDSTGFVSSAAAVVVTVVGSLTSSSLTITPTTTDVGYSVAVSVSSGSGVSPYSYSWTITLYPSGSASGSYTTTGNKVTFTKSGVYSVTATVKDSTGEIASLIKTITVNALPTVTITPSSPTVDAGATVSFSNTTSGGTAPITYNWGYPTGAGITHSGNQFTFADTGNFTVKLYVNDSMGASGSVSASVSVNSQPIIIVSQLKVNISAPSTVDTGTSVSIGIVSVSGTGPYTAQLEAEAPGATSYSVIATSNQFSTLPEYISSGALTVLGQWQFKVQVTEVDNTAILGSSRSLIVTVVPAPASSAISVSPTTTDIGSPVSASMSSGYGTSPYSYAWTVTLSGGASAAGDYTSSGNQLTFSASGVYTVTVAITDADGLSASTTKTVTVNAPLSISISSTTPTTIDKGQTVTFSYSATGGSSPYTVSYSVSTVGGGIAFGAYSVSGNVITFSVVGQYEVSTSVVDALNEMVVSSSYVTVTVNALPSITLSTSTTTVDTGNSVTFTNVTVNGTKPYVFAWAYPSGVGITRSGNSFTFADQGNFTITLSIRDAVGVVASSSVLIHVNPSPVIILGPNHPANQQSSAASFGNADQQQAFQGQKKILLRPSLRP